ncbi:MAG: conserved repeat domain [Nocardioides sp.]|nr:conserved repeat domain [Nocardioides sp.]
MSTSGFLRAPRAIRISIAVTAAAAAGLVALVAPLDGRADATTSACVVANQPLGSATGWTEFVEGNGTRTSESEGSVAYGGNLNPGGNNMPVGSSLPAGTPTNTPTLVVAGTSGSFNLQRGSSYLGDYAPGKVNFNGGGSELGSNPLNFATSFANLRSTSTTWGGATSTGTVTAGVVSGSQPAWILTGTDPQLNVFSMTATQLAAGKRIVYAVPASAVSIINVLDAGAVSITGNDLWVMVSGNAQQTADGNKSAFKGVIWNLPNASSLSLRTGGAFGGSVLAPNAAVTVAGPAHTIGQMIAKSFTSGVETHPNDFPESPCLPPTGPPSGPSDVKITKTASVTSPHGGDFVTYNLKVENVGLSTATGVVVKDVLPAGVTFDSASSPCTQSAGVVACSIGDVAVGAVVNLWIKVVANPVAGAGSPTHPSANHWLTPYKVEQQVSLVSGQIKSVSISCNAGDIVSDGSIRIDQVDQGTGTLKDIHVLSSRTTGLGTWEAVVQDGATGNAQAKGFIVCLPAFTEAAERQTGYNDSHRHPLSADATPVSSTQAYGSGRSNITLTCPTGTIPIVPGYALSGGAATLAASSYDKVDHPRDWTFTLDVTSPTTATFSVRCLRTTVGAVYGHTHDLRFTHVVKTVTVSGSTAKEGDEFQVICPDDAKGVVATWDVPPGVSHFGNDPRLKERAFRLYNDSGTPKTATVDLLCLHDRTTSEEMGTTDPVVVDNTATVTSVSADANGANNSSVASITVQPGSSTTGLVGSGRATASAFSMRVVSSMPGTGALTVRSNGTVLAQGSVTLKPGRAATASLRLTAAGRRQLGALDQVTVRVDPTRGRTTTRTVSVVR